MKNNNDKIAITKRKVLSLICLVLFSLAFIFSCLNQVFPFGRLILCTFGLITYPLFLILALISLAYFLGLSYKRSVKSTLYFTLIVFCLLFAIHSITNFKELDKVVSLESLKEYINYCYVTKVTLLGSVGSIISGTLSLLLGAMGVIVAFVILLTIFIGVWIDYENYGRFENKKVKELKTRALRQKVDASDKDVQDDNSPSYSFSNEDSSSEVVDTLEVDPNELSYEDSEKITSYSQDDVVDEVYDNTISPGEDTEYSFNSNEYKDDELDQSRKNFINGTFYGDYNGSTSNNDYASEEEDNNTFSLGENNDTYLGQSNFGRSAFTQNDSYISSNDSDAEEDSGLKIDKDVMDMLNREEPEVDMDSSNDSFNNNFVGNNSFDKKLDEDFWKPNNPNPVGNSFDTSGFSGKSQQTSYSRPFENNDYDWKTRNEGIRDGMKNPASAPEPKTIIPAAIKGVPTAMPGVRYNPPPISLLSKPVKDNGDYSEEQNRKARQLEDVLESFGINAKVANIVRGPKITRYELSVPRGVSVKKIPTYEYDIQRSLAAKTVTIRAPIPGKEFVGIELENDTFTSVSERELFESPEFINAKDPLTIAIGKDISGEIIVKSLTKMVHSLVAGSTGSGKSVFIHNVVLSLLYKHGPEDLRFVMIDPKEVEFGMYNGLPHLLTPTVVLGREKAVNALQWCVKEMKRRFKLMGKIGFNDISLYNKSELVKSRQLEHFPYIVIVVDELAELMMYNKKDTESAIQSLTQLARACGMYMVIAVQRPSVDIITGVIKNNISTRIAFRLQDGFASKTMLGTVGAEKLLGKGDMLLQLSDTSSMPRLQGAFATNDEIKGVVDFVIKNNVASYDESIQDAFENGVQSNDDSGSGNREVEFLNDAPQREKVDELFKVAVKLVMLNGSASISLLQRKLAIGYARAGKIIDQMEERGFIASAMGAKQRKVLISPDQFRDEFGEEYNS